MAKRFAEAFEAAGLRVWWDVTLRSGEAYDQVTEKALGSAKAVVVLWSRKSVESRWVRAEATLADRNRTLVPAMIEPCERPIMFELTQTADLSHWTGRGGRHGVVVVPRRCAPRARRVAQAAQAEPVHACADRAQASRHRGTTAPRSPSCHSPTARASRADDVFADGMVEDLISALSLSDGIKVIAQSATVVYRKNVSDLRSIGRGARRALPARGQCAARRREPARHRATGRGGERRRSCGRRSSTGR